MRRALGKSGVAGLAALLVALGPVWVLPVYGRVAQTPACVSDQPFHDYSFSSVDPHIILQPGQAAAQTFRPTLNTLCTLYLEVWADAADLGRHFIFDITVRESLDAAPVASLHVDTYPSYQSFDAWDPFVSVQPEREYFIAVEVQAGSQPLLWYWMTRPYDRGSAWIRQDGTWQGESGQDLLFFSFGFNDLSSFPLPDTSWTEEEWQSNNWKTYPVVATWLDLNRDGKADVETYNNSYLNETPVSTDGNVRLEDLDRAQLLPVNLSLAFEFTSYKNATDGRSALRIHVDRLAGAPGNQSSSDPAWIFLDGTEFLPLLFAPPETALGLLNLTWESTLEENAFRVYLNELPEKNTTDVWIYIGHFSVQSITIRGPVTAPPPRTRGDSAVVALVAAIVVAGTAMAIVPLWWARGRRRP